MNGYDHMMYIMDMPASFSGKPGFYKLLILRDKGFDISIPAPPPLTDPHHVHSYLVDAFGRIFSHTIGWSNSTKVMWLFQEVVNFKIKKKVAEAKCLPRSSGWTKRQAAIELQRS
jgi:hypothetical protein